MIPALTLLFSLAGMACAACGIWLLARPLQSRITPDARHLRPDLGGAVLCLAAMFLLLVLAHVASQIGGAA